MTSALSRPPIRVLLADDHLLFRTGLRLVLAQFPGLAVVGEAGSGAEAVALAAALDPDVLLLDLCMPGMTGVDTLALLRRQAPRCAILMLTISEDALDLRLALQAGARGYLIKSIDGAALAQAIARVAAGETVVSETMNGKILALMLAPPEPPTPPVPDLERLTPRERDILTALGQGSSNKTIARDLGLSESTVKIHVQHVLKKLHCTSRVQAALLVARRAPAAQDAGEGG